MIVWGGGRQSGGFYDPASDAWALTALAGAPAARSQPAAAWTGTQFLIWGGSGGGTDLQDGARNSLPLSDLSHVAAADPGTTPPAGWAQGPFMEIYVRGYQDSDGDGTGDLRGLIQRLDYLKDLGITGLWLMPVTLSEDHDHGYAVEDYRAIEPDYGSLADLDDLLVQAHARGMGVIIDYVMNHSARTNPLFASSSQGPTDPFRDWYVWSTSHPAGWSVFGGDPWRLSGGAWYYAPFWDQMPDFNLKNAAVVEYHHDNLRFWLNRGVDGFRFDAVGNLVENGPTAWENQPEDYALMGAVNTLVAGYTRRFMVCEDPADPPGMGAPAACGSAFAFGHNFDIAAAAAGASPTAVASLGSYFTWASPRLATLVANHDSFAGNRLWDQVGGDPARYRLAAATYLLQPGTPSIYYGEEIGMSAGAGLTGDWALRSPMSWGGGSAGLFTTGTPFRAPAANAATQSVAAELGVPGSLHTFYKEVIALRKAWPALATGSYDDPQVAGATLAFGRTLGSAHALVVLNYSFGPASVVVQGLPPGATLTARYPPGTADVTVGGTGVATVPLPASAFAVFTW
jgi:glycosidase